MDLSELPAGSFRRHPWEIARARFFCDVLRAWGEVGERPQNVLDIGAGDGYFAGALARELAPGSKITCVDSNYRDSLPSFSDPQASARTPAGAPLASLTYATVAPKSKFDLLLMLDVLEHVPDDLHFLSQNMGEHLDAGGHVLISVPAGPRLYTRHDLLLRHYRRYRPQQLRDLVQAAGLGLVAAGGVFHSLLIVRAAQKLLELARGRRSTPALMDAQLKDVPVVTEAGRWRAGGALTTLFTTALRADNRLSTWLAGAGIEAPGLSTWALVRRA